MNKVAVVTGGSGTIGSAIAKKLSDNYYDVIVTYNTSKDEAEKTLNTLNVNGNHMIFNVDVSSSDFVKSMFKHIYERYGEIDLLVNNAGYTKSFNKNQINDIPSDVIDKMMGCNIKGVFYCSREFLNLIDGDRSTNIKDFNIINIGSNSTYTLNASNLIYVATKSAVISLTKSFAKDYGEKVRVNCILPGLVRSKLTSNSTDSRFSYVKDITPLGRLCQPEDIADTVLSITEDMKFINGQCVTVDGGRTLND